MSDMEATIRGVLGAHPKDSSSLIQVLLEINKELGYLPLDGLQLVSQELDIPLARIFSAATFYKAFSLSPRGEKIIKVCMGTACHIRGAPQITNEISRQLGIQPGETTEDLSYTLETVNCLGACAMAPLVAVNEDYHGGMRIDGVKTLLNQEGSREDA